MNEKDAYMPKTRHPAFLPSMPGAGKSLLRKPPMFIDVRLAPMDPTAIIALDEGVATETPEALAACVAFHRDRTKTG